MECPYLDNYESIQTSSLGKAISMLARWPAVTVLRSLKALVRETAFHLLWGVWVPRCHRLLDSSEKQAWAEVLVTC